MAAVISGRSSVEQDDEVMRRMRATPRTPTKMTPYRGGESGSTQRRRGLFQPSSPVSSESSGDLGHMSPLTSSVESLHTIASPPFSPNGRYASETPMKTRSSTAKEISVKSSLFPALTKTPLRRSTRCSPRTKDSPSIRQSVAAIQEIVSEAESTPRSSRCNLTRRFVAESVASPSSVGTPPSQRKLQYKGNEPQVKIIPATPTTVCSRADEQNLPAVSPENFYGPKPINPASFYVASNKPSSNFHAPAAPRATLLIDTISMRGRRGRRDSDASIRSNITVASKRQRSSSGSTNRASKRQKSAIPGVWHAIKKPKKMNKKAPQPKPVLSPNTRVAKLKGRPASYSSKPDVCLFEEKPRNRVAGKRSEKDPDRGIFDTFPSPLIKRKKLPSTPVKDPEPDTNKKFMKYGSYRKAVFKIDNMSLEFKNGSVRMKSPAKPRRVRTKKSQVSVLDPVDFDMPEPETSKIHDNVEDILLQLAQGDCSPLTPQPVQQVEKITDEQLLDILESPSTKVKLVRASPRKVLAEVHSSPQRALARNMSGLQLCDAGAKMPLSGLLLSSSNILNGENDQENMGVPKLFPVFDPTTWKSTSALTDLSNTPKQQRKKKTLVGDDQYLLDAGQKSVAIVKCKDCGVMYQAGDYLDEMAHNNFHNHLTDLSFMGWKGERVVSRFQDGRVVMVVPTDPKPWLEKARKAVGVVDLELGFSENYVQWTPDKKILLFICEKMKQIVGCLVAEKCTEGFRMYPPIEGVELDTCARDPTPCKVGISRIWSAVHRRRQRVASRLFQALCRVAGDVAADDVAFSIPSPDGKMLARSLVNRQDFKVYGFLNA